MRVSLTVALQDGKPNSEGDLPFNLSSPPYSKSQGYVKRINKSESKRVCTSVQGSNLCFIKASDESQ